MERFNKGIGSQEKKSIFDIEISFPKWEFACEYGRILIVRINKEKQDAYVRFTTGLNLFFKRKPPTKSGDRGNRLRTKSLMS